MENFNDISKIDCTTELEQKMTLCAGLIEIAKTYCDYNYDKSSELSVLSSILEIVLTKQKELVNVISNMVLE